ncbi:hypothetical protein Hanom_Chr12g01158211 [Helianthus anomalus]
MLDPQSIENHSEPSGVHASVNQVNLQNTSISFFGAPHNSDRPKYKTGRIRPRNKHHIRNGSTSPSSDIRPKKRSREEGVFSFDLNRLAGVDQPSQSRDNPHFAGVDSEEMPSNQEKMDGVDNAEVDVMSGTSTSLSRENQELNSEVQDKGVTGELGGRRD